MALSGKIRGRMWRPLGSLESVKATIATHFPGATFGEEQPVRLKLPWIWDPVFIMARLRARTHRHPYWIGLYENKEHGWAAEFDLGSSPTVRKVYVRTYGLTTTADRQFAELDKATGWITRFAGF